MLSIVIYSNNNDNISTLKSLIQNFLIEYKTMAKVSILRNGEEILTSPSRYDIYFVDMETETNVINFIKQNNAIDPNSYYICMSADSVSAIVSTKAKADYFITEPFDPQEICEILLEIKKEIKEDSIIIRVPSGERRVRINELNYIDIVKRCLCYHLYDGAMFDGQVLRGAFEKEIGPLQYHPSCLFLPPSLLINLNQIKEVYHDHVVFENNAVTYFPKKAYDKVRNAWVNYNKII